MATETAIDVVMPQMGVSVSEGTVTRWLKQEGEHVEADEPLLEISTDKIDTEVPSPGTGTVTQILVQEGETVDVGTKLAQIGGGGAAAPVAEAPPEPAPQQEAAAPAEPAPQPVQQPVQQPAPQAEQASNGGSGHTFISPVVARIASEHNVDPAQVSGTGRGGRVTKKDILDFIEQGPPAPPQQQPQEQPQPQAEAPAPPAAAAAPAPAPPQAVPAAAPAPPKPPAAAIPVPPSEVIPGETVEPISAMRRGIAEHMRRSLDTSAHVTSAIEVDMSRIVIDRKSVV